MALYSRKHIREIEICFFRKICRRPTKKVPLQLRLQEIQKHIFKFYAQKTCLRRYGGLTFRFRHHMLLRQATYSSFPGHGCGFVKAPSYPVSLFPFFHQEQERGKEAEIGLGRKITNFYKSLTYHNSCSN